jgi:sulfur carrier protein ThiS
MWKKYSNFSEQFPKKTSVTGGVQMSEAGTQKSGGLMKLVSEHRQKVSEILQELGLKEEFFAVLINGRKASLNEEIEKGTKIIVLPKIKGG